MTFPVLRTGCTPGLTDTSVGTSHAIKVQMEAAGVPQVPVQDLPLLLFVSCGAATTGNIAAALTTAGWNLLYNSEGTAGLVGTFIVARKIAGAADPATVAVTTTASTKVSALCFEFSATSVPLSDLSIFEFGWAIYTATTATYDPPPQLTTLGDNLWLTGVLCSAVQPSVTPPVSGLYTLLAETLATLSTDGSISVYQRNEASTTQDPGTFSLGTAREGIAFTLAVKGLPNAPVGSVVVPRTAGFLELGNYRG